MRQTIDVPPRAAVAPFREHQGFELETSLTTADSPRAGRVVPANACSLTAATGSVAERGPTGITHVVIHTIGGHYNSSVEGWRSGRSCLTPHYVVRNDGEVTQVVSERYRTAHANRANGYSIGIEHDGFATDPRYYTDAMYRSSAALVRDICARRNIPMDREHIIGHDEAPGTSHGDPGGYWDWDYFIALVNWGGDPRLEPRRIVVDTASPNFRASAAWTPVSRTASVPLPWSPHPEHSWSASYRRAAPDAANADHAWFGVMIPEYGWWEVALWWPVLRDNNPSVIVRADKLGHLPGNLAPAPLAFNTRTGRTRRTLALPATPMWRPIGNLACVAGNTIWVGVSRLSTQRGWIIADAVRLLKKAG